MTCEAWQNGREKGLMSGSVGSLELFYEKPPPYHLYSGVFRAVTSLQLYSHENQQNAQQKINHFIRVHAIPPSS